MKKILFIAVLFCISWTACNKTFLEKSPIVGITEENFYRTEEDAIAGVNAAYATLQFQLSPAGHFRWFWGDIMSDDAIKGGSGDNDANDLLQLETFKGASNTDLLESEWGANFEGIYRANVVLEKVPEQLARRITTEVAIPTIGIGASPACDGQVLVVDDMLGLFGDFRPKFVKRYAELGEIASAAIADYAREVRERRFPGAEHLFSDAPATVKGGEAA